MTDKRVPLCVFILVFLLCCTSALATDGKKIVGWVEQVTISSGDLVIHAKLDTGAKTSSIDCDSITPFERNNKKWVRFEVTNNKGKQIVLEQPVERIATIKRHFGKKHKRYVVRLALCLAGELKEAEVNLEDRSGFNYRMLIGRSFLKDSFIIDPSLTFTTKSDCKVEKNE